MQVCSLLAEAADAAAGEEPVRDTWVEEARLMIKLILGAPTSEVTMTTSTDDTQTHLLKLVRYAARRAGVATSKRDAAIREASRAGASLRDIATESGMSHMTVKRIVERVTDCSAPPGRLRG